MRDFEFGSKEFIDDMMFKSLTKPEERIRGNEMETKVRMPYGKFKGKEMHEVPSGYLRWAAENLGEYLSVAADKEWQWRDKNQQHWEE